MLIIRGSRRGVVHDGVDVVILAASQNLSVHWVVIDCERGPHETIFARNFRIVAQFVDGVAVELRFGEGLVVALNPAALDVYILIS
jgi:hypothetical protein